MFCVRDNAAALLFDAQLLKRNDRISRAYALAYSACEESGKLSILVGAATQVSLGIPIDWKVVRRRFRSHDSKASQFTGLANAIPIILNAAKAGHKTVDSEEIITKATAGVLVGPALFSKRNASLYCDFDGHSFTSPDDQITESMTNRMIQWAENHVIAANAILRGSQDDAITRFRSASREQYDSVMLRAAEAVELLSNASTLDPERAK